MNYEVFIPYEPGGADGVLLNCYKEQFSLIQAGKTSNGDVYMKWCFPKKKDGKPTDKPLPMKVDLGNEYDAKKILRRILATFDKGESKNTISPESDKIPWG